MQFSALVSTNEQLEAVLSRGKPVSRVILDSSVGLGEVWSVQAERIRSAGKEAFFAFPPVFQEQARKCFLKNLPALRKAGFSGFLMRSLEEFAFGRENGLKGHFQADQGIYAFNSEAKRVLLQGGFDSLTVPLELSRRDMKAMDTSDMELIAYGYVPMMVSHNCVHATLEGCDHKGRPLVIIDRLGHGMRHMNDCRFCLSTIYNAVPLYLMDCGRELQQLKPASLRLSFTFETKEETEEILGLAEEALEAYIMGLNGPAFPGEGFTRGHFRNAVE